MSTQIGQSGLLALKTQTYKDHINGNSDKHDGYSIELVPTITINGSSTDNVYEAIEALNTYVSTVITDATTTSKGVVQLANDLSGTASSPNVVKITGDSVQLNINPRSIVFSDTYSSNDIEFKYLNKSIQAKGIKLQAQGVINGPFNILHGGDITISSGLRNSSNGVSKDGKIFLNVGNSNLATFRQITLSSRVISLFKDPTSAEIPGEANNTVYVYNTTSNPTQPPISGSHLYSLDGKLKVYHANADNFNIGDNPANWQSGSTTSGVIHKIGSHISSSATQGTLATYTMPSTDAGLMLEVDVIGKAITGTGTVAYKLIGHFYCTGSVTPVEIGTEATVYSSTNNASGWTAPSITISGNNILVKSGAKSATIINWSCYAKGLYKSI